MFVRQRLGGLNRFSIHGKKGGAGRRTADNDKLPAVQQYKEKDFYDASEVEIEQSDQNSGSGSGSESEGGKGVVETHTRAETVSREDFTHFKFLLETFIKENKFPPCPAKRGEEYRLWVLRVEKWVSRYNGYAANLRSQNYRLTHKQLLERFEQSLPEALRNEWERLEVTLRGPTDREKIEHLKRFLDERFAASQLADLQRAMLEWEGVRQGEKSLDKYLQHFTGVLAEMRRNFEHLDFETLHSGLYACLKFVNGMTHDHEKRELELLMGRAGFGWPHLKAWVARMVETRLAKIQTHTPYHPALAGTSSSPSPGGGGGGGGGEWG
jgi:hypothetical protein